MYLFLIDDANQRDCPRAGVTELIAVGGIIVSAHAARDLDNAVSALCEEFGFPEGETFKWSPARDQWMRDNLRDARREIFFRRVLATTRAHGAVALVAMVDPSQPPATYLPSRLMEATMLCLERFDNFLRPLRQAGIVIAAEYSSRSEEEKLLAQCLDTINEGTDFAELRRIAINVLTMPFRFSRLLQIADLVVSCSTALTAGHTLYSEPLVPEIKALLRRSYHGRIGGVGMKLHPDFCFLNLYHWLWGDTHCGRGAFPLEGMPYARSGDEF